MMNLFKILFRWWLDGWKILVYYFAFYIIVSLLLGVPVYLWKQGIISGQYDTVLMVIYLGVYLPFVFRGAAAHLGKFPAESTKKDNPEEDTSIVDSNSKECV